MAIPSSSAWLQSELYNSGFDYCSQENNSCPFSYWTYDAKSLAAGNVAWEVRANNTVTGQYVTTSTNGGVRPVIKVLKENLK